jgi:transposase
LYNHTGRPPVDLEVFLRMLLIVYLYEITSERRLCKEVQMRMEYRWFVGLSLEDKTPDHSTFLKNRHERFLESGLFQELFDEVVK